jgi:hypothetical protein
MPSVFQIAGMGEGAAARELLDRSNWIVEASRRRGLAQEQGSISQGEIRCRDGIDLFCYLHVFCAATGIPDAQKHLLGKLLLDLR